MNTKLKKFILISAGTHLVLFFILYQSGEFDINFFNRKTAIVPSLKVDIVALPDKIKSKRARPKVKKQAQVKKPKPKVQKKPKPKPKPKQVLNTPAKPKPKPKPTPKPKQQEPQKVSSKPETELEKTEASKPKEKIKGNQVSKGVQDGPSQEEQIAINAYLIEIIDTIKSNWNLPKYLTETTLYAQVEVRINSSGKLVEKTLIQSSQNSLFDSKVLKAIEASAPFDPPPEIVQKIIKDGLVFGLKSHD